ncbi:MAG: phospho-N-acetylmuramoyl-pentapeptide-transferase [Schwartzia sp. (in: firmicutes)]
MQKKSPIVGALLGLFVIGLIYSGGLKKGGLTALALIVVGFGLNVAVETTIFSTIANVIGAGLGYMWTNEYNAALEQGNSDDGSSF